MSNKLFKNLDEQVEILVSKGLTIKNFDDTKNILFRENYFFISGYRHLFMRSNQENRFIEGTTFDELYAMFLFDRRVRNIMFKYILVIENNMKSIISYQMSKKYGIKEKDYLNPKNFTQDSLKLNQVRDIIFKMRRQIKNNGKEHEATLHYLNKYGYIPMWILVKVLSFGIIAELYCILKVEDQMSISEYYNLDVESLSIYLALLSNFRNICAHEEMLYNHRTQRAIPDNEVHYRLKIDMTDDEYIFGKNDLFALVIIMKAMLSKDEFHELVREVGYEIDILDGRIDIVTLNSILNKVGFPDNWRDIVDI